MWILFVMVSCFAFTSLSLSVVGKAQRRPHLEQSRSKCNVELRQRSGIVLS
jgi:hypothetical protein